MTNIWNTPSQWTAEDEARLEAKRALAEQRQATWDATHPQADNDEADDDDDREICFVIIPASSANLNSIRRLPIPDWVHHKA